MPGEIRAVLDTNIVVSGLISQDGPPGQIIAAWRAGRFEWITSAAINEEILEVLHRPGISEAYHIGDRILDLGALLYTRATLVEPSQRVRASRDPDDDKFLDAALLGRAAYLVTGDKKDLLALGEYRGIQIVTPARFMDVMA